MSRTVFISYSRRDGAFVERLHRALVEAGHEAWLDAEQIPPSGDWRAVTEQGIESAEVVIFVMTADSLASRACLSELDWAVARGKRIIALVREDAASSATPDVLAPYRQIFLRDEDDLDAAVRSLASAIESRDDGLAAPHMPMAW